MTATQPAKMSAALLCVAVALAGFLGLSTGCNLFKRDREIYVPIQKTAREQFMYAAEYRDKHNLILRNKERPERQARTRESIKRTFQVVVEQFPEDREVTPMARLELADMLAGMDPARITPKERDLRRAIAEFQKIQDDYPEIESIQAKARLDEGLCWVKLKDYEKAQNLFRDIEDAHRESKDPDVQKLVKIAHDLYQNTYVK
ncbi:hypothetical protein HYR69_04590 [Candidatus Sumerlaeota bacterium]|nr:hypothetical protein [Candidatus Sumerlaeota bacterium]MBI3735391.1 hypothetical protein [Candidatus Sumerlaeota bacterium]